MRFRIFCGVAAPVLALAAASGRAEAGAFQLNERSTKAIGAALSGATSAASDVTFAGFNPAALSTVEHAEIGLSANLVSPIADGTVALTGEEVDADQAGFVPGLAAGYRVSDSLVVGLTSYAPFGLATDYESDWIGRFDAETSKLATISISPTVAWTPVAGLTVGGAVDVLYIHGRLTSAALNLEGDDWQVGFSLGALFEPVEGTTIGAAYHHGFDASLDIDNTIKLLPGAPTFSATADASLPPWASIGVTQAVTPRFRLMAEARWIGWEDFDRIAITTPDAPDLTALGQPDFRHLAEVQNYENSVFVGFGGEYDLTDRLTLRGGIAYDQTPTTDRDRTPRVPDEDRLWFAAGASYALGKRVSIDAAYAYLHALDDATVRLDSVPTTVDYDGGAHIFSLGATIRF